MKLEIHPQFKKSYTNRITNNAKLAKKVSDRLKLFQEDPSDPLLKDHALSGEKSHLRAFWITGDMRIVYLPVSGEHVLLLDIGSHNQVY